MNFKTKIFLTTLIILTTTLLLNSMMSIFSFEKNYVNSLISTYEIAGNALKKKIEQSLLFGKPLDKFQGMNLLFKKMADQNKHISQIWIEGMNGNILYEFNKIDSKDKGLSFFKNPDLIQDGSTKTLLSHNHYLTVIPLRGASKNIVGWLYLSFPQKIIYDKTKEMIKSNLNILWPIFVTTSFCLIFFLAILIFRPLNKELAQIIELFKESPESDETGQIISPGNRELREFHSAGIDVQKVKNEMDMLKQQIRKFIVDSSFFIQRAGELKQEQELLFALTDNLRQCEIDLQKEINHVQYCEKNKETLMIQTIIDESRYVRETVSLINEIIRDMELFCCQR